jgi:hypothetical protein
MTVARIGRLASGRAVRLARVRLLALVTGIARLRPILRARLLGRRLLAVGRLVPVRRRILRLTLVLTRVLLAERIPGRLLLAHDSLPHGTDGRAFPFQETRPRLPRCTGSANLT